MAETVQELETELAEVNTAISAILKTGVSYSRAGFSMTRAGLNDLRKHRDDLRSQLSRATSGGGGSSFVTDYSGVASGSDGGWND